VLTNYTFDIANKRTVVFVSSTLQPINSRFLKVKQDNDTTYLVQVPISNDVVATGVICKASYATEVLTGPLGCDDPLDPSQAVVADNCPLNDQEAARNKLVLESSFWLISGSSACIANGGDKMSCFGPMWAVKPNTMYPKDNRDLTVQDFIGAQRVVLETGWGPRCDAPFITELDIVLPSVNVTASNCTDRFGIPYQGGLFEPFYNDPVTQDNDTFIYAAGHQRISLQINDSSLTVGLYRITLYSSDQNTGVKQHTSLEWVTRWTDVTNGSTVHFDSGCWAKFALTSMDDFVLRQPKVLDDLNYALNQLPDRYYFSSECGHRIGRLDEFNQLKYPYLKEGEVGGGRIVFKTPDAVAKPIHVDPDPNFADYVYIDTCDPFYPPAIPFAAYQSNVSNVQPYLAGTGLCFAPFLDPDLIQSMEGLGNAKYVDCYKQGGYLYDTSGSYCFRPIQVTKCKAGWLYYHQYCYRKIDADKELKYLTVDSLATDALCQQLNPYAKTIKRMTRDVYLFLQRRFVFWQRQGGYPYRVNMGGKSCLAFDIQTNSSSGIDQGFLDDIAYVYQTNCETGSAFPVCRYHVKDVPIPYSEVGLTVETIQTLRDGQSGVPHVGRELQCKCQPGWSGRGCEAATCHPPSLVGTEANHTDLVKFFAKCYSNSRGSCQDKNPRTCKCYEGYGPLATWTSVHYTHPCACPSVDDTDPSGPVINGYVINDVFYQNDGQMICGGSDRGQCVVNDVLNLGVCQCTTRINMDPDAVVNPEPAWDGTHCTAPVAMIPADQRQLNGDLVQRFCNAHGTACPSGERYDEQRLDESYFSLLGRDVCRRRDGTLISGCVCDDGWSGPACTCPVPKNILIYNLLYPVYDTSLNVNRAYAALKVRGTVLKVVNQDDTTCALTRVFIQDQPSSPTYECEPSDDQQLEWICPDTIAVTKVFIETAQPNTLFCSIRAYDSDHPPCGNHPLPWAGAFFRNEVYRSYFKYELPQSSVFAPDGCTWTECMCQAGFTGALCSYGVSAMRYDYDMMSFHNEVCGGTTLSPRGQPIPGGKGCQCFKVEGLIQGEAIFSGPACEGVLVNTNGTWLECGDRGYIVNAKFPTGVCQFDQVDLSNDPLKTPFFGINPAVTDVNVFVFDVPLQPLANFTNNSSGTVLYMPDNDGWWVFPPLTSLYASPMFLPPMNRTQLDFCDPRTPLPVNISYGCPTCQQNQQCAAQYPQRASVYGEFWTMKYICSYDIPDWRNPVCYQTIKTNKLLVGPVPTYPWCPLTWSVAIDYAAANDFDIDFQCLHHTTGWSVDPRHVDQVLESGFYEDVVMWCGSLEQPASAVASLITERSFATGVFDCSNPIDRVLADTAWALGLTGSSRQCSSSSIKDHSDVNGAWYGLFEGFIPGLKFTYNSSWSDDELGFLASLLGINAVCEDPITGKIIEEAFDGRVMDSITKTWVNGLPQEVDASAWVSNRSIPLPLYTWTNISSWRDYRLIEWGNPYTHVEQLLNGALDHPDKRPGLAVRVPLFSGQYVRKLSIRIPFTGIEGMQVVGPDGVLCYTSFHRTLNVNDTVDVTCTHGPGGQLNGFVPTEPEWVSVLRMKNLSSPNTTLTNDWITKYYSQDPFQWITVLWSQRNFNTFNTTTYQSTFQWTDFTYYSRNVSYSGLFESLKRSILIDHRFPAHTVYQDSCLSKPGRQLRTLNLTIDEAYLRRLHLTHLASRRCSDTSQCKKFARNQTAYECVFDQDYSHRWRGVAEQSGTDTFIGDEGGCECTEGHSDSTLHCTGCIHGYGPATAQDKVRYEEMMALINASLPVGSPPVTALKGEYCAFPWDPTSLRENKVCGGRGNLVLDQYQNNVTVRVFLPNNETRRCAALKWVDSINGTVYQTFTLRPGADDYDVNVMRYHDSVKDMALTVIHDEIFMDHTTKLLVTLTDDPLVLAVIGQPRLIQCQPTLDDSTTHAMKLTTTGGNQVLERASTLSFFRSKLIFRS
jgi:hypothetical protein